MGAGRSVGSTGSPELAKAIADGEQASSHCGAPSPSLRLPRRRIRTKPSIELAKEGTNPSRSGTGLRHPGYHLANLRRCLAERPSNLRITHVLIAACRQLEGQGGIPGWAQGVVRLMHGRERVRVGDRRRQAGGTGGGRGGGIADLAGGPCRPAERPQLRCPWATIDERSETLDRLAGARIRGEVGLEDRQRPLDAAKGPSAHGA